MTLDRMLLFLDLLKAIAWSLGTALIVLNYYGVTILGGPLSFLAFGLIAGPVVLSITQGLVRVEKTGRAFYWIVLMSISLRLIVPLSEGRNAFMIGEDPMFNFQVAGIIAERGRIILELATGRAIQYILFPGLQILTVQISTVGSFSLYDVARFLPVILTIVTIMMVFKTYSRMMTPQMALAACFLFSVCYKYNWFDGYYLPESLGLIFFVMAFYAMMQRARGTGISVFVISVLSILVIMVTHFFSSLMLSTALGLCYVFFRLMKRNNWGCLRIGLTDIFVALVPLTAWLTIGAAGYMNQLTSYIAFYQQTLLEFLSNPFHQRGFVSTQGIEATGIHLTGLTASIVILGVLFSVGVGLIGMARAIQDLRGTASPHLKTTRARVIIFCAIAFAFGVFTVMGVLTQANSVELADIVPRLIPFIYFFLSPAFSVGILFVGKKMRGLRFGVGHTLLQRRTAMAYLCVGIVLIMAAASCWLLMPSTIQGRATLDDGEVTSLSFWLRTNGDKKIIMIGDVVMPLSVGALARQPIYEQPFNEFMMNDPLYYGSNMSLKLLPHLSRSSPPVYLLINEAYLRHKYYLVTHIYESKPPPSEKDMAASLTEFNAFPMLDRVYSSSSLTLYVSAHS